MDHQKVVQVLKDIFEQCGTDIVRERRKFEGAISDLLDRQVYRQEYIVLKHAMDSAALWQLTSSAALTGSFTTDAVSKAVMQMQTEGRLTAEDAEFVVECVVDACGGEREILKYLRELKKVEKLRGQENAEQLWEEEKKRMQEEIENMQEEIERMQIEEKHMRDYMQEIKECRQKEKDRVWNIMERMKAEIECMRAKKDRMQEEEKEYRQKEKDRIQAEMYIQKEKEHMQEEMVCMQIEKECMQIEKECMQEEKERIQKEQDSIRQEEKTRMQKETVIRAGLNKRKKKFRFAGLYIVIAIAFMGVLLYTVFTVHKASDVTSRSQSVYDEVRDDSLSGEDIQKAGDTSAKDLPEEDDVSVIDGDLARDDVPAQDGVPAGNDVPIRDGVPIEDKSVKEEPVSKEIGQRMEHESEPGGTADGTAAVLGNSAGNIHNGGLAVEKDGWVYYYNIKDMRLCKTNNSEVYELAEGCCKYLNVMDGWIYYYYDSDGEGSTDEKRSIDEKDSTDEEGSTDEKGSTDEEGSTDEKGSTDEEGSTDEKGSIDSRGIYRMHTDGSGREMLAEGHEERFGCLTVTEDWIYYIDAVNETVRRMSLQGGAPTVIAHCNEKSDLTLDGDWIYFEDYDEADNENDLVGEAYDGAGSSLGSGEQGDSAQDVDDNPYCLFALNIKTGERKKVAEGVDKGCCTQIADGWVYYKASCSIWRIKPDGTGKKGLVNMDGADAIDFLSGFIIADGWVYCEMAEMHFSYGPFRHFNHQTSYKLWKAGLDGTKPWYEQNAEQGFSIAGDWLYFIRKADDGDRVLSRCSLADREREDLPVKKDIQHYIEENMQYDIPNKNIRLF